MIPLLDIGTYHEDPTTFVKELRVACHKVGFFLLKHDLPANVAEQMLDEARRFFDCSLDKKLSISYQHSPAFRGYMQLGVENTAGKTDVREQVEYAVETKSTATEHNTSTLLQQQPLYERLRGENPWPDSFQPSLKTCTMEYVKHVCRIADLIREAMCLALGLDQHVLDPLFDADDEQDPPHWVLKLVSYPITTDSTSFGVGPHTDTNFLTLVLQDTVGGLQVFSEGTWIDVPTDFGSTVLVCNLGEQAQLLSNGYLLATPHRVLSSNRQRISVPLFYNPKLSSLIQPMMDDTSHLEWERPHDYEKETHWTQTNNCMLETVGDNTFKSLARSHPSVFRKHHADLELLPDGRIVSRCSSGQDKQEGYDL